MILHSTRKEEALEASSFFVSVYNKRKMAKK